MKYPLLNLIKAVLMLCCQGMPASNCTKCLLRFQELNSKQKCSLLTKMSTWRQLASEMSNKLHDRVKAYDTTMGTQVGPAHLITTCSFRRNARVLSQRPSAGGNFKRRHCCVTALFTDSYIKDTNLSFHKRLMLLEIPHALLELCRDSSFEFAAKIKLSSRASGFLFSAMLS